MSTRRGVRRTASSRSVAASQENAPVVPLRMSRRQASNNPNQSRLNGSNFLSQYSQLVDDKDKNLRMYFVLPEGKTRATCDSKLAIVFALCEDFNLEAEWINEADCLKLKPEVGNIFVLSPFEGPAFDYLEKCRENKEVVEIIGPQCIHYTLSRTKDPFVPIQNQGYSTSTLAMRGVMACVTGMNDREKIKHLKLKIQRMGGQFSYDFTEGVTHVIVNKPMTPKCSIALKKNIPLMKLDWVDQVWIDSHDELVHATDEKYMTFVCPVFYKLTICVSQISQRLKQSYKEIIEEHGGKYSKELNKAVSILIVPNEQSEKFDAAQKWRIPCLKPEWVDDSKSAGYALPLDNYLVQVIQKEKKISTPQHSMVQLPPDKGVAKNGASMNDSVISCVNGARGNYTEASQVHEESELTIAVEALDTRALNLAASKGPYLDGCAIYISGNSCLEKVKRHINAAGAIHLSSITKNVTHVLADKKLSAAELEMIEQLNIKPYIVNLKWLVASASKGSPEDEELYAIGTSNFVDLIGETILSTRSGSSSSRSNSDLSSKRNSLEVVNHLQEENDLNVEKSSNEDNDNANSRQVSDERRLLDVDEIADVHEPLPQVQSIEAESDKNPNDISHHSEQPPQEVHNKAGTGNSTNSSNDNTDDGSEAVYVFTDCKIKVAVSDETDVAEVAAAVEKSDGQIVAGPDFDVIVLPVAYDAELFPGLDEAKCVTKFWVTDSIDCQSLIPLNNRKFYHKPVKMFKNMNTIMTNVVIAVTQYSNKEKFYLANLAEAMGATYQEVFARRESKKSAVVSSTHLICPNTNSDKYRAACKWGKIAVVAEWLVDSCAQKKIVSEAQYNPELVSDSDSQSQSSYIMPQTPKVTNKGSTKAENPGRTSTVSVMASSATRPTGVRTRFQNEDALPSEDKSPFKTPTSVAKKNANKKPYNLNSSEILERELQNPAFLEYLEKQKAENGVNENRDIDAEVEAYLAKMDTSSFRAYKAEQRVLQGLPPEEQPSIEIEGMTTEEARDFRIALEVAGLNTPPPNLRKKPKKLPTPTSVMMKRSWKQIMEKFPVTSTPKARKSSTSSLASVNSDRNPHRSQGVKRASDSSLEDDVVLTGGKGSEIKRLRISSESEDTDISEIHGDQDKDHESESDLCGNKSVNNQFSEDEESNLRDLPLAGLVLWISPDCYTNVLKLEAEQLGGKVVTDFNAASITHVIIEVETQAVAEAQERNRDLKVVKPSWVTACVDNASRVEEIDFKSIPSSKRSARELADMLRMNDEDRCGIPVQKQKRNRTNPSSSIGNGEDRGAAPAMNPDEYDAPAVVWDDDDSDSEQVGRRKNRLNLSPPPEIRLQTQTSLHPSRSKQKSDGTEKPNDDQLRRANKSSTDFTKTTSVTRSRGKKRAESEDCAKPYPIPRYPKFMLSGIADQDKTNVMKNIQSLGGEVVDSSYFTPEVDALLTHKLARSEKVLASIASGKLVLKGSYLDHCVINGKFMPVTEDFLWKNGDGTGHMENEVANSAHYWFLQSRLKSPVKPFENKKFFVYDGDTKSAAYTRLILAGGGEVVTEIQKATIIIRNKVNSTQKDPIAIPAGIPVESPMILSQWIIVPIQERS